MRSEFKVDEISSIRSDRHYSLCPGVLLTRAIFTHLISHRKEVKRRCRTVFQARATELSGRDRTEIHHPADVIPTLASV